MIFSSSVIKPPSSCSNILGASLIGNQLLLSLRAVSPVSPEQYSASISVMKQIAQRCGFHGSLYGPGTLPQSSSDEFMRSRDLFLQSASSHFGGVFSSIASKPVPYDQFKSHNLLSRSLDYCDIVRCGLMTFVDADDGLAAVESDLRGMFSDFVGRRHSKKSLMKRSAIYKLSQLSLIGLAAAIFSGSPLVIVGAGLLASAGFGINELRMLHKTALEFSFDLAVSRTYQASIAEMVGDYRYIRAQRKALLKESGYFR